MPNIPSMKVYLNLVYNTGVPGISSLCKSLFVQKGWLAIAEWMLVSKVLIDNTIGRNKKNWLAILKN
jgi:hypothetical protein